MTCPRCLADPVDRFNLCVRCFTEILETQVVVIPGEWNLPVREVLRLGHGTEDDAAHGYHQGWLSMRPLRRLWALLPTSGSA